MQLENEKKLQLERERISRDLHDSLGASANAIVYNTELLQVEEEIAKRNILISELKFASKDIITSLRETVWALTQDRYTSEECLIRIKNFIQPLSKSYGIINFTVQVDKEINQSIVHNKALNIVRMVQEAVTNAIKYANPKNINVKSFIENNKWIITVTDDGSGFDYQKAVLNASGNGLTNLKHRAISSDIQLEIESSVGVGTTIKLVI